MATTQPERTERPRFYEQQYLGARDLTGIVQYARESRARHDLGAHLWGIAQGLELVERPSASGGGSVDAYIQPGFAWDGFGRPIALLTPCKIPPELFKSVAHQASDDADPKGHLVRVWLSYVESPGGGPATGFDVCATDDQYTRVWETFRVVIGDRPAHEDQHDPVDVAGHVVDAAVVLRALGSSVDPLLADESVSYQSFPEDWGDARWLIPLGSVRWLPGTGGAAGSFQPRKDDASKSQYDLTTSERQRRYIGVVAETINAAHDVIRMRDRAAPYDPTVWSDDLVWVEGPLRVEGDAKLFNGKLDFRDSLGEDNGIPLTIGRLESNGQGGIDLQVRLGSAQNGSHRLVVGADPGAGLVPALLVQADAKVGVGSVRPSKPLTVRAQDPSQELIGFEDPAGALRWHLNQNFGGVSGLNFVESGVADGRLFIKAGGNIGIGTTNPTGRLTINGMIQPQQGTLMLFSPDADFAYDGGSDGLFIFKGPTDGATAFMGGNVGIGTPTPASKLEVSGDVTIQQRIGSAGYSPVPFTPGWGGGVHTWDVEAEGTIWSRNGYEMGDGAARRRLPMVDVISGTFAVNAFPVPPSPTNSGVVSIQLTSRLPNVSSATMMVALSDIWNVGGGAWMVQVRPAVQDNANTFTFKVSYSVTGAAALNNFSFVAVFVP